MPSRFRKQSRGGRGNPGENIDINRFINKAQPLSETAYTAKNTFQSFNLDIRLLENVLAKGYTAPMAIQDQTIMPALEGKDLIGLANTGMGKTAAFLIPLINKTLKNQSTNKTLIIAPTRELAEQI